MEMPIGQVFTEKEVLKTAEALKIELSEYNKKLLMDGSMSEMIEVDGKKSKIALKRNNKGDILAAISHKKETLEIPDKIPSTCSLKRFFHLTDLKSGALSSSREIVEK